MKQSTDVVVNWSDHNLKDYEISIVRLVEENAETIRDSYISYINSLGKTINYDKSLIDLMEIGNNFSLWWMTLIYEKNFYKSPKILDCLKLIALRDYVNSNKIKKLKIINIPRMLNRSITLLSKRLEFELTINNYDQYSSYSIKSILKTITPNLIRSFYTILKYFIKSWKFYNNNSYAKASNKNSIMIVSYFLNFNQNLIKSGEFESDYWSGLDLKIKEFACNYWKFFF